MTLTPGASPSEHDDQIVDEELESTPGVLARNPASPAAAAAVLLATFAACAPDKATDQGAAQADGAAEEVVIYDDQAFDPTHPKREGSPVSDAPNDRYAWAANHYEKDDVWGSGYVGIVWSGIDLADDKKDEGSVSLGLAALGPHTRDTALGLLADKYARKGDARALSWIERMNDPSRRGKARDRVTKIMLARSEGAKAH